MNTYYWKGGWLIRSADGVIMARAWETGSDGMAIIRYFPAGYDETQTRRFVSIAHAESWGITNASLFAAYKE